MVLFSIGTKNEYSYDKTKLWIDVLTDTNYPIIVYGN